jgi:hypothetical protein
VDSSLRLGLEMLVPVSCHPINLSHPFMNPSIPFLPWLITFFNTPLKTKGAVEVGGSF